MAHEVIIRRWHHAPLHIFAPNQFYIVTASTLYKKHYFKGKSRLAFLQNTLFEVMEKFHWELQAWAIFSNHYHFVAQAPAEAITLKSLIQELHSRTAIEVNRRDNSPGRQVWFQYWDTCLTYERSYLARLNYVHNNPVKHGLVNNAEDYPFCSAAWFRAKANADFRRKVSRTKIDRVKVYDDF